MENTYRALRVFVLVFIAAALGVPAHGADIVASQTGPSGLVLTPLVKFEFGRLTVNAPDGVSFQQDLRPGATVVFNPSSRPGYQPPDGTYLWEVTLVTPSAVDPRLQAAAKAARESGDAEAEVLHRVALSRVTQAQSGAFTIQRGAMVPSNLVEPGARAASPRSHREAPNPFTRAEWLHDNPSIQPVDQVIPDDLIVQGSACIGLDCVNNESFGFDTIRLKENNTRIKFDDTSTLAGFPANDWQLTANDSASGGSSKFSIEDITGSKVPFTITAGAATNSIFVDSTGRVGLRTSTPVLDVHVNTSNTPAHRLEQNNSGGFTAQTWDVAGNEANFFVRDVTGGSRLPFRIRPGAPTSSIDINASGNVGIGTASPVERLHVVSTDAAVSPLSVSNTVATNYAQVVYRGTGRIWSTSVGNASEVAFGVANKWNVFDATALAVRMAIDTSGNVGVGTASPTARLHTVGTVRFAGLPSCGSGIMTDASGNLACIVSSRDFKNVTGDLEPRVALANVMALRPQVGSYKATPDVTEHWLVAEDTAAVDPALVGLADGKPYTVKTQNVVADLIAVVQQQQRWIEEQRRVIEEQQRRLEALERASAR
jgi:hypothetical protein